MTSCDPGGLRQRLAPHRTGAALAHRLERVTLLERLGEGAPQSAPGRSSSVVPQVSPRPPAALLTTPLLGGNPVVPASPRGAGLTETVGFPPSSVAEIPHPPALLDSPQSNGPVSLRPSARPGRQLTNGG